MFVRERRKDALGGLILFPKLEQVFLDECRVTLSLHKSTNDIHEEVGRIDHWRAMESNTLKIGQTVLGRPKINDASALAEQQYIRKQLENLVSRLVKHCTDDHLFLFCGVSQNRAYFH